MMHLNRGRISRIVFKCIFLLMIVLPVATKTVSAQTAPNFVTVYPTTPDSQIYTTVGKNWTVSFEALWSYGDNSGTEITNATVTVQVNNSKSEVVNTLSLNTTDGVFSFNYSSTTADVLTFTPIKLVEEDGAEWTSDLLDDGNSLYRLQSKSVVVWYDTFHTSLVSYVTDTLGVATVSVNVTYLLLPEEGLALPEWATYSNETFLPKIAHDVNVTINGVTAEETSMGVFKADVPIWLPTAYVHVGVSREGWVTTGARFSFAHDANEPSWQYSMMFGIVLVVVVLAFVLRRNSGGKRLSLRKNYSVLGGALLLVTSVISLYWGLVGIDSTVHGFEWMLLAVLGMLSFGFGLATGLLSLKRKNQPLVIFAATVSLLTNFVCVKIFLDMYTLASPLLLLITSVVLSAVSGFLICNSDEAFT